MIYEITHKTTYRYGSAVLQSQHLVHMSPRDVPGQVVRSHGLAIEPAPLLRTEGADAFGNPVAMLDIEVPHKVFVLDARSTVEMIDHPRNSGVASVAWDSLDDYLVRHDVPDALSIRQMRCSTRLTEPTVDIKHYAQQMFPPGRSILEGATALAMRIYREFTFDAHATDVSTPITHVFRHRRGVCQDFAHLMLAALRSLGIPCRYVSGYILTLPPKGLARLQGADASHAWVAVWTGEGGWVGLDPTNGIVAGGEHITFAWGRDYDDVCPMSGVLIGGGDHTVSVAVDVVPVGP